MHAYTNTHYFTKLKVSDKAVADGTVVQVLAGPLFLKVAKNKIQKASNKTKVLGQIFGLVQLVVL